MDSPFRPWYALQTRNWAEKHLAEVTFDKLMNHWINLHILMHGNTTGKKNPTYSQ